MECVYVQGATVQSIDINAIEILKRWRDFQPAKAAEIAASMDVVGQLQPILVRPGRDGKYVLVAGLHRVEGRKKNGSKTILATVVEDMDADQAELAGIDENLIRANLTVAERAMHVAARKSLYEKLHPQTKQGGQSKALS